VVLTIAVGTLDVSLLALMLGVKEMRPKATEKSQLVIMAVFTQERKNYQRRVLREPVRTQGVYICSMPMCSSFQSVPFFFGNSELIAFGEL
jgi:hypothetical protein